MSSAHDPKKLLWDIVTACVRVTEFCRDVSFEQYRVNALVKSAVQMQLIVIGEALVRLRATDLSSFERITDANRIIAFRNVLAHG